jgi:hypothetical protein
LPFIFSFDSNDPQVLSMPIDVLGVLFLQRPWFSPKFNNSAFTDDVLAHSLPSCMFNAN